VEDPRFYKLKNDVDYLEIFIKALGYVASLSIIMAILFSPIVFNLYIGVGLEYTSMYEGIWIYYYNLPAFDTTTIFGFIVNVKDFIFWILFIISGILLTIAFFFFFGYGKKTFAL